MGDKVELKVALKYAPQNKNKVVVFFKGFRILCGNSVSDGYDTLVPVFVMPTKKGGMGRRHYGNAINENMPWWENIVSIKKLS